MKRGTPQTHPLPCPLMYSRFLPTARIMEVLDKGKAAAVTSIVETRDATSGKVIYENQSTVFIRGAGGFGGKRAGKGRILVFPLFVLVRLTSTPSSRSRSRFRCERASQAETGYCYGRGNHCLPSSPLSTERRLESSSCRLSSYAFV